MNNTNCAVESSLSSCVGCGNCTFVCPVHSLEMKWDREGFLRPLIDNNICIRCGKCRQVCQMYKQSNVINRTKQNGYIAISKNKRIYKKSASGGIFATLAEEFLNKYKGSIVIGAAYVNEEVRHICIKAHNELYKLQNSKYVQSNLNNIFEIIKRNLDENNNVLFSGTPCQVAALRLFLRRDYVKLFCIDLICHGVPSPLFLNKELKSYGKIEKITEIRFRNKSVFYRKKSAFFLKISGKYSSKIIVSTRSPYFNMFMNGLTFRPSCYECKFTNLERQGDITIGDCDSSKLYPSFHHKEATSCVLINTSKGKEMWDNMKHCIDFKDLDIVKEAEKNHQLSYPIEKPLSRNYIYDEIMKADMITLRTKYAKPRDWKEKLSIIKFLYLP